jgi:hypothetical protein
MVATPPLWISTVGVSKLRPATAFEVTRISIQWIVFSAVCLVVHAEKNSAFSTPCAIISCPNALTALGIALDAFGGLQVIPGDTTGACDRIALAS